MKNILEITQRYIELYPDEQDRLKHLRSLIESGTDVFDRKNYQGHITGGCLVFNQKNQVLLVHHNIFKRYFHPAGHIDEQDETILDGSLREVLEETGISDGDILQTDPESIHTPFYIDTHTIPKNNKKAEDQHYHTGFVYILKVKTDSVTLNTDEVSDFQWMNIDDVIDSDNNGLEGRALKKFKEMYINKN